MNADFRPSMRFVRAIASEIIRGGLPEGICLNVNIPDVAESMIKGIRVCRQAKGTWQEDFDEREDPHGRKYYWMKGVYVSMEHGDDSDQWAVENNYIAMVPVQLDFTANPAIKALKNRF